MALPSSRDQSKIPRHRRGDERPDSSTSSSFDRSKEDNDDLQQQPHQTPDSTTTDDEKKSVGGDSTNQPTSTSGHYDASSSTPKNTGVERKHRGEEKIDEREEQDRSESPHTTELAQERSSPPRPSISTQTSASTTPGPSQTPRRESTNAETGQPEKKERHLPFRMVESNEGDGLGKRTKVLTVFPTVAGGETPLFSSPAVREKRHDGVPNVVSVFPAGGQGRYNRRL
jgi:hypothetical protein